MQSFYKNAGNVKNISAKIFYLIVAFVFFLQSPGLLLAQNRDFNRRAYEYFKNGLLLDIQGNTQEAIKELMRASQIDPENPVILKTLGDLYIFKTGDYGMGAAIYEKYLELNPTHDRTIGIVTQIYSQSRPPLYSRLENVLTSVISNGNDKPEYYRALIDALLKQKKTNIAKNISINYIKNSGEAQQSCELVADLFINNSMVIEGLEYFGEYWKENPGIVNLGITVGMLNESKGDPRAAEVAYIDVLNKDVTANRARTHLALLYLKMDKIDNALALYNGIDFDDPGEVPMKLTISEALFQQPSAQFKKIELIMESVENKAGTNSRVFFTKGRAQSAQNRLEDAADSFNRALLDDPSNVEFLYFLSQTELEREKFDEAADAISKAVQYSPEVKSLYVLQGIVYDRMGDFEKAANAYQSGINVQSRDNSAHPTLLNNYSYLLSENDKDLEKALEMVQQAIRAEPENSSFLDTIGWVHFKLGNLEEALINIKKSVSKDPENAEVLDHLGDVYLKMDNIELAVESWQNALKNDKDNESIIEKLNKYKKDF